MVRILDLSHDHTVYVTDFEPITQWNRLHTTFSKLFLNYQFDNCTHWGPEKNRVVSKSFHDLRTLSLEHLLQKKQLKNEGLHEGFWIKPMVKANVILTLFSGSLACVAKGVIFCGAESPASTDPYTMRIKISTLQVHITDITNNYGQ